MKSFSRTTLQQLLRPIRPSASNTQPFQSTSIHPLTRSIRTTFHPFQPRFRLSNSGPNVRRAYSKPGSQSQAPTPNPTPSLNSPAPSLTLAQRMRKLSREYGYSALGVYLALSAIDFPFCLLAVRWAGTERIGRLEEQIKEWFWSVVPWPSAVGDGADVEKPTVTVIGEPNDESSGWGVEQAQKANEESGASLWTQVVLAYAIHKSFIFIRVPITAAITPKVVKVLRGWGWNIGKRTPKKTT